MEMKRDYVDEAGGGEIRRAMEMRKEMRRKRKEMRKSYEDEEGE